MIGGARWQPDTRPGRRLFVAVPVSEPVREKVAAIVEAVRGPAPGELGSTGAGGDFEAAAEGHRDRAAARRSNPRERRELRWVRLDGIHLTLRFLGPTPDTQLEALADALQATGRESHPFEIRLSGAGGFPSADRPRALWLGVVQGVAELAALASGLDRRLEPLGWPPDDRPFRAHLTLARADGVPGARDAVAALVRAADGLDAAWEARRLVLFESHTGHGPARYEPLVEVPLGG